MSAVAEQVRPKRPAFMGGFLPSSHHFSIHFPFSNHPLRDALDNAGIAVLGKWSIRRMKKRKMEEALDHAVSTNLTVGRCMLYNGLQTPQAICIRTFRGQWEKAQLRTWQAFLDDAKERVNSRTAKMLRHRFYNCGGVRVAFLAVWFCQAFTSMHDLLWSVPTAQSAIPLDVADRVQSALPEGTHVEYEELVVNEMLYDPIVYVTLGRERYAIMQWD